MLHHPSHEHKLWISIRISSLWSSIIKLQLTINIRALTDIWFSNFLLLVGHGFEEIVQENFIRIRDDIVIPYTEKKKSLNALTDAIYVRLKMTCSHQAKEKTIFNSICFVMTIHKIKDKQFQMLVFIFQNRFYCMTNFMWYYPERYHMSIQKY